MKQIILSVLLLASINVLAQTGGKTKVQKKRPLSDSAKNMTPSRNNIDAGDDWLAPKTKKQKRKNNFGGEDWDVKSPTDSTRNSAALRKSKQQNNRRKKKPANNFGGEEWDRKPLQKRSGASVDSVKTKQSN